MSKTTVTSDPPVIAKGDAPVSVAAKVLVAASLALTVWVLLTTLNVIRLGWIAIPVADDWDRWITLVRDHYTPAWFFAEHVDHRLVMARLLFTVDHLAFDGRGWFLLLCSASFQAITGFLLWRLAGRAYRQDWTERVLQAAVILCFVFSAQQWMNFIMPFQVQFPMVYCASIAALYALWKSAGDNWSASWLTGSIALAAVATYSMANGILVWLVMLIAAFWLGMPRKWMAGIAAAWVLIGIAYFYGWHSFTAGRMGTLERLPRTMIFWPGHLGSPLFPLAVLSSRENVRIGIAAVVGALLALALLAGFITLWRHRERFNSAGAVLLSFCIFLAMASATMAYGRSPFALTEIYSSRYLTPSYLFWVSMLLAGWPWLRRMMSRTVFYGVLFAVVLLVIAIHQRAALKTVRDRINGERLGEIAVVDNVFDPDPWLWLFHTPSMAVDAINYMRDQRLTVFTEEWTHWPGIPLNRRFTIDRTPDACQGQYEQTTAVASTLRPGWRATGWAWDNKAGRSPRYIVLADPDGMVAGVAITGFPPPPALSALSPKYAASTWSGYVTGQPRPITAYVVEADERSLCAIGTQQLRRPGAEVDFKALGLLLPVSTPEINGSVVPNGFYKGPGGPGIPPVDGPIYGTFPDAEKGAVRVGPFHLDGHTAMAIPIVTGPDNHGLSILVRDVATREVLAQMDPPSVRTFWWAWRPDLPEGRELNVEVVAEDKGSGWGQWIAIAWPHTLKQ